MIDSPLQRLIAGTLAILLTLSSVAPGGKPLVLCVAGGDHSHVFIARDAVSTLNHDHDHGDEWDTATCCHAAPCCDAIGEGCHSHNCLDIALPGGDFQSQVRKSVAQADIGLPLPVQSTGLTGFDLPQHVRGSFDLRFTDSSPHLLRSAVLII